MDAFGGNALVAKRKKKKKKKSFYLVGRDSRTGRYMSVEKARKWGAFAYVQKVKIKRKKKRGSR